MNSFIKKLSANIQKLISENKDLIKFHFFKNWQELIKQPFIAYYYAVFKPEKRFNLKIYLSYLEYQKLIETVLKKIKESGFEPDHIAAISRGGLLIGLQLSHAFQKPLVLIAAENWPDGKKSKKIRFARHSVFITQTVTGKILLVDDMTESGESLLEGRKYLENKFSDITKIQTATIFHKEWSKYQPDYWGKILKTDHNGQIPWMIQPFEN